MLFAMVQLVKLRDENEQEIPPPLSLVFPIMMQLVKFTNDLNKSIPPLFAVMMQLVSIGPPQTEEIPLPWFSEIMQLVIVGKEL